MRTIIAGSRTANDPNDLSIAISECGWKPTIVLSGCARGADKLGEDWANANSVTIERYPARWDSLGRSAGYARNIQMAKSGEALIALWDGESRGTKHMIETAKKHGLKVHVRKIQ